MELMSRRQPPISKRLPHDLQQAEIPTPYLFLNSKIKEIREYVPELRDLIGTSMKNNLLDEEPHLPKGILLLLYHLLHRITDVEGIQVDPAILQHGI